MSYDGRAVANCILDASEAAQRPVTNLALQKLVYFCHAWSLAVHGKPLVKHQFEAWKFGPVLQYLYREFKEFDRAPIITRACKLNPSNGRQEVVAYQFDDDTQSFVERVLGFYGKLSPGTLVELSHAEGSPWDLVWNHDGKVNPGMRIADDMIRHYYGATSPPF